VDEAIFIRSTYGYKVIAEMLGTTAHAIKRINQAFTKGGMEELHKLRWCPGAPPKNKALWEELQWLLDPRTLKL
jgi:hypothetical protein